MAEALLDKGVRLYNGGRFAEAARCFRDVLKRDGPGSPAAFFLERSLNPGALAGKTAGDSLDSLIAAGRSHQACGDLKKAAAAFSRARKAYPDALYARLGLAETFMQEGRCAQARRVLSRAAASDSDRLGTFRLLIGLGRFRDAFALGESILRADRRLSTAASLAWPWGDTFPHVGKARLYFGPVADELGAFNGRGPWAPFYAGILKRRLGRGSGLPELEAAARAAAPRHGWMLYELGRCRLYGRDFPGAIDAFSRAAGATAPPDWKAYAFVAEAWACLGKRGEALKAMERSLAAAGVGEAGDALAWKGQLLLWLARPREAAAVLDEAIRRGGRYAWAWRGAAKVRLGTPREALADLDCAIELKSWDLEAWVWRGEAKRLLKDHRGALADLDRVLNEADEPWALMNRGLVWKALGDEKRYRADLGKIDPELAAAIGGAPGDLLETGLRLNSGCRRGAGYACAVWFPRLRRKPR